MLDFLSMEGLYREVMKGKPSKLSMIDHTRLHVVLARSTCGLSRQNEDSQNKVAVFLCLLLSTITVERRDAFGSA